MTVQSVPRPITGSPLLAAVLVGGLAAGFIAGQVVPTVIHLGAGETAPERASGFSLGRLDDYGIRVSAAGAAPAAASGIEAQRDDWGLRHPSAAQTGARSQDDYGLRHPPSGGE